VGGRPPASRARTLEGCGAACACILNKQVRRHGWGEWGGGGAGAGGTCLLLGDVYGLVEDDPCGSLVTRRHRGGAVVRHVMLRVRQKFAHPETFNFYGLPCAIHTVDNVNVAPREEGGREGGREGGGTGARGCTRAGNTCACRAITAPTATRYMVSMYVRCYVYA